MKKLTHVDGEGEVAMVDVAEKRVQLRTAVATGEIILSKTARLLIDKALIKKGDVLTTAEIAGIQAAKRTSELIPLCHPLITDHISVKATSNKTGINATARVRCHGRTGAEMEALTAVSVALLTVYDMCKAVDKSMIIKDVHLVGKEKTD